jgi:UDPglucose 6-dehydrogenase
MDRRSSELTKYGANAMLATRISFMNELARLCEKVGANVDNVRHGMGADQRIGRKFLYAGPGYGGSCFPKDVEALLKSGEANDVELKVLNAVSEANRDQKQFVASKIKKHFGDMSGKTIAIWGLSFKPGTDDVRDAPAKTIIQEIVAAGGSVVAHDPQGINNFIKMIPASASVKYVDEAYDALKGADALCLVTEWPEYKRPSWNKIADLLNEKVIFDFRNQYMTEKMLEEGFHYQCVGRPDSLVKI